MNTIFGSPIFGNSHLGALGFLRFVFMGMLMSLQAGNIWKGRGLKTGF